MIRRLLIPLGILGLLVGPIPTSAATATSAEKIAICHFNADNDPDSPEWELLQIKDNRAVERHLEHGDMFPGDDVPGTEGAYVFGDDCSPVLRDSDGDGVSDVEDNCLLVANTDQSKLTITFDEYPTPGSIASPGAEIGDFYADCAVRFTTPWWAYDANGLYPPKSGKVQAIGTPFPAEIVFLSPVSNVSAHFNVYVDGITFTAYDEFGVLLGIESLVATTQPTPGGPKPYSLPFGGIKRLQIDGPSGTSTFYSMDDLSFDY